MEDLWSRVAELNSSMPWQCLAAAKALATLGPAARPALPALRECLGRIPQMKQAAVDNTVGAANIQAAAYIEQDFRTLGELEDVIWSILKRLEQAPTEGG